MTKKFSSETNLPWWKKGVIYQIYPRSFNDTSGNGIGDLKGIYKKISYLSSLGVDALWLSPIFTSPMKDMGYDVSNYTDIDPLFGNIYDFEKLNTHGGSLRIFVTKFVNFKIGIKTKLLK